MKELELIIDAVMKLSEVGKEAFIWWLVLDKGFFLIEWLSTIGVISFTIIRIVKSIESATVACKLRDAMGIGTAGPLTWQEERQMFDWIKMKQRGN